MNQPQETLVMNDITTAKVMYIAFELANTKWKLAFSDGSRDRQVTIDARDLLQLHDAIDKAMKRFRLEEGVKIICCYEAGRDGFWLYRHLQSLGIEVLVVDSASIEVSRRSRRAKTDRLDANKLLAMLMRYRGGEKKVWSVVRVPSVEEEDARQLHRELEVLKGEQTRHISRIKGLLMQQRIYIKTIRRKGFFAYLDQLRTWDGQPLPVDFKVRLVREYERLQLVWEQIKSIEKERQERVEKGETAAMRMVSQLRELSGIGPQSSWLFVMEFFGWRQFRNRREVAALAGLTHTPYDSGSSRREQGIRKSGNRRIRTMSVEIAWVWLRFQPQSKLTLWFNERFALGGKRMRRIGIVAVARKLLIDLWRFLEYGVIPEGARLKTDAA